MNLCEKLVRSFVRTIIIISHLCEKSRKYSERSFWESSCEDIVIKSIFVRTRLTIIVKISQLVRNYQVYLGEKLCENVHLSVKSPSILTPAIIGVQCNTSSSCALKLEEMDAKVRNWTISLSPKTIGSRWFFRQIIF